MYIISSSTESLSVEVAQYNLKLPWLNFLFLLYKECE
jgi:hypothetical protein